MSEPVRTPWDFSTPVDGKPSRPNVPTELGTLAGRELARLTKPALEDQRARFPGQPPPCNECAFLEGTDPNRSPSTVMDAIKCVVECVPFFCHKGVAEGDEPARMCAGWSAAVSTFDGKPVSDRLRSAVGRSAPMSSSSSSEPSASPVAPPSNEAQLDPPS